MTSVSTVMSRLFISLNDKLVHEYLKQDIFIFKTYSFKTKFDKNKNILKTTSVPRFV
jgi:hypothetical protein